MGDSSADEEIAAFLERWFAALEAGDAAMAADLREPGYSAELPDGRMLTRDLEAAMIASFDVRIVSVAVEDTKRRGRRATVRYRQTVEADNQGERIVTAYRCRLLLARSDGVWRARRATLAAPDAGVRAGLRPGLSRRLLPAAVRRGLRRIRRALARAPRDPGYIPHAGGADFVLPKAEVRPPDDPLPIPPRRLWLGYDYPAHAEAQVSRMLDVLADSGLSLDRGDRVLDLGCGAGRMIRHLRDLAGRCEIWGADISAEHILWCQQHLSPPFHFLVNTRAPHLPFEDRSFRLVYGGSLFTHIDELAAAWLLELHRILDPGGRLYLTIHDRRTIELFDDWRYASSAIVREIKANPLFRNAKEPFDMMAVGRGEDPQVFYDLDRFARLAGPGLELVSATGEAYFYQTAVVLKRRA